MAKKKTKKSNRKSEMKGSISRGGNPAAKGRSRSEFLQTAADKREYATELIQDGQSHKEVEEAIKKKFGSGMGYAMYAKIADELGVERRKRGRRKQAVTEDIDTTPVTRQERAQAEASDNLLVLEPQQLPGEMREHIEGLKSLIEQYNLDSVRLDKDGHVEVVRTTRDTFKI